MSSSCIYVKESDAPLSQLPKNMSVSIPRHRPYYPENGVEWKKPHETMALWKSPRLASTPKTCTDSTTCSEGMSNTAHTTVSQEVMFPVIYASQSFPLPRQPTTPFTLKVPVSTCSSDITLSLYFLWNSFDEKWVIFLPTQAGACGMPFFCHSVLEQGATQRLFQTLFPHHPGKNASEQACRWSNSLWI